MLAVFSFPPVSPSPPRFLYVNGGSSHMPCRIYCNHGGGSAVPCGF